MDSFAVPFHTKLYVLSLDPGSVWLPVTVIAYVSPLTIPVTVFSSFVNACPSYVLDAEPVVTVYVAGLISTVASSINVYSLSPTSTVIWTLTLYVPTSVNDGAVSLQSSSPSATVLIPSSLEDVVTSWYLMDSTEINSLAWSTYTGSKPVPSLSV